MTDARDISTSTQFAEWLSSASGGERVIYHCGFLARDTASGLDMGLINLSNAVWKAAVEGRVYLTQGNIGEGAWAYIATAAARNEKVVAKLRPGRRDAINHRAEYQKEFYKARKERLRGETELHKESS
jgi:hypothetical protein